MKHSLLVFSFIVGFFCSFLVIAIWTKPYLKEQVQAEEYQEPSFTDYDLDLRYCESITSGGIRARDPKEDMCVKCGKMMYPVCQYCGHDHTWRCPICNKTYYEHIVDTEWYKNNDGY